MKYLFAYSIPLISFYGIVEQGYLSFLGVFFAFVFIPILELILPVDENNYSIKETNNRKENKIFDALLYLNLPIVYMLIVFSLIKINATKLDLYEILGTTLSLGIVLGANGINVAHELGHRKKKWERILGKTLLIPSLYMHFHVEHNLGHHLNVATNKDPSSANYNQNLYSFWLQTIIGTYKQAWKIQIKINKLNKNNFVSIYNDMLWFTLIQIIYIILIYFYFGLTGLFTIILAAIISFLLLETINYVEHYALKRKKLANGKYEKVTKKHSWNSNHIIGRIMLYELTRHSDHHYKATKKYQILEHNETSPQLPFGYPTSILIALVPPLWFSIMNKRVPEEMKETHII